MERAENLKKWFGFGFYKKPILSISNVHICLCVLMETNYFVILFCFSKFTQTGHSTDINPSRLWHSTVIVEIISVALPLYLSLNVLSVDELWCLAMLLPFEIIAATEVTAT